MRLQVPSPTASLNSLGRFYCVAPIIFPGFNYSSGTVPALAGTEFSSACNSPEFLQSTEFAEWKSPHTRAGHSVARSKFWDSAISDLEHADGIRVDSHAVVVQWTTDPLARMWSSWHMAWLIVLVPIPVFLFIMVVYNYCNDNAKDEIKEFKRIWRGLRTSSRKKTANAGSGNGGSRGLPSKV